MRLLSVLLSRIVISSAVSASPCLAESRVLVPSTDEFRRNGEGSLMTLNNGRLLFVYTQWYSGTGSDHDLARSSVKTGEPQDHDNDLSRFPSGS